MRAHRVIRRVLVTLSLAATLAAPVCAAGQSAAKTARVGFLSLYAGPISQADDAILAGLRDLGYVEGRNLVVERRYAAEKVERLDALAAELVDLKVDVIIPWPFPAIRAAQRVTRTIPIVFPITADPVGTGLVASLARPGANITGVSAQFDDFFPKFLELLKETLPRVTRVAFLSEAESPRKSAQMALIASSLQRLKLQSQLVEWQRPSDLHAAFDAAVSGRADALITMEYLHTFAQRQRIVELATARRLPSMFLWREYVELGGLMAYGPNLTALFRRSATYVDKIVKGAKPEHLPVEQPTVFDLSINLRTARALGVKIPDAIVIRATTIIDQ